MPVHHRQKKLHTLINDLCCSPALKLSCPSVFITVCVSNKQPTKKLRKHTRLISPSTRIFRKTSSLVRKQIQTKTTLKSFFFHSNFFLMPLHQLMRATDLENHMTSDTFAAFRQSSSWGLNNQGEPLSRVESWRRRNNLFRIMFRMSSFSFSREEGITFSSTPGWTTLRVSAIVKFYIPKSIISSSLPQKWLPTLKISQIIPTSFLIFRHIWGVLVSGQFLRVLLASTRYLITLPALYV